MGVRTFLNTIETLANPAGASTHLGSFYHLAFAKKTVETFALSDHHDLSRVIMFQGMEGYDDIRPGYTKVAEWRADEDADGADGDATTLGGGAFTDYEIETAEYGMDFEYDDLAVGDVAADSAAVTREVLAGDRADRFYDAVALNAAFRIYAGGGADGLEDGLATARAAIDDGAAAAVLESMQAF
jgi:anthranilate phosphoribosyltransferase